MDTIFKKFSQMIKDCVEDFKDVMILFVPQEFINIDISEETKTQIGTAIFLDELSKMFYFEVENIKKQIYAGPDAAVVRAITDQTIQECLYAIAKTDE